MADDATNLPTGDIVVATPSLPAPTAPLTPMELLGRALERGADIGVLEKLMDLQERHERNVSRKAFDAAVAEAKAEIKPIRKNRTGHNDKKYADLGAYASGIDAILASHGLSYRYRSRQETGIHVTCVLSHRDGYNEETTLSGPADTSGNKNSIQAIGSTITYLQRYTLTLALGLSVTEDDDGHAASGKEEDAPITEEQIVELTKLAATVGANLEKFCVYAKIGGLEEIRQSEFEAAKTALKVKAKKKAAS